MVDAPDKIWATFEPHESGKGRPHTYATAMPTKGHEYVRADLYKQAVRELAEALRDYRATWKRAEAAERLAGARVKALIDELKQATHYDCIPSKTENAIDNTIAYLSALAEPAGEAEPVACVACEDNPKGENNPCAVCGKALTPPDASAIRGAPTHRHKKRGTEYTLIGIGKMQAERWVDHDKKWPYASKGSVDMREVAIYRCVDDGSLWVRPREEFEDGRFEVLVGAKP